MCATRILFRRSSRWTKHSYGRTSWKHGFGFLSRGWEQFSDIDTNDSLSNSTRRSTKSRLLSLSLFPGEQYSCYKRYSRYPVQLRATYSVHQLLDLARVSPVLLTPSAENLVSKYEHHQMRHNATFLSKSLKFNWVNSPLIMLFMGALEDKQ